jgi:hypothetical protein
MAPLVPCTARLFGTAFLDRTERNRRSSVSANPCDVQYTSLNAHSSICRKISGKPYIFARVSKAHPFPSLCVRPSAKNTGIRPLVVKKRCRRWSAFASTAEICPLPKRIYVNFGRGSVFGEFLLDLSFARLGHSHRSNPGARQRPTKSLELAKWRGHPSIMLASDRCGTLAWGSA